MVLIVAGRFTSSCRLLPGLVPSLKGKARTRMTLCNLAHVRERVELTQKERQIFDHLLQVLRHFNLKTQLRVAGGWVRDKLLSKDCYDIDIALDNMLGREFCEKVNEYLVFVGEEKRGVGVIQCNPDQSKHLETARMHMFDMWIDFVNLRSETYAENSRIPEMKFGTAEEDAYRRDLTINSLFYNINTDLVEDLTGRGINDLKEGIIATPLPPKATLLDDPLRVLRAIRFGARFEFVLHDDLKRAASDDEVRTAISEKVSKERIGHEIDLMVSGNQPVKAMSYISDLELFWTVFDLPHGTTPTIDESCHRVCVSYMAAASYLLEDIGRSTFNDDQRRLYLYGALFVPLMRSNFSDPKGKKMQVDNLAIRLLSKNCRQAVQKMEKEEAAFKSFILTRCEMLMTVCEIDYESWPKKKRTLEEVPVVNSIFRNSLKLKASDSDTVIALHKAAEKFSQLIPFLISNDDQEYTGTDFEEDCLDLPFSSRKRILTGLLLMDIKEFWRVSLLISTLLSPNADLSEPLDGSIGPRGELYKKVEKLVIDLRLENVWEMKRLVDGKAIMGILGLKSGGPVIGEWQKKLLKWQLAHPFGTFDESAEWLQQSYAKRAKCK